MKESENFDNAKQVFQKGDFLRAFDLAQKDLEKDPKNHDILYLATLCLARSGATDQAISSLNNYKFQIPNTEDFLALRARLYKDKFLTEKNISKRKKYGKESQQYYLKAFKKSQSYYPVINAATVSLLLGDSRKCNEFALETLKILASIKSNEKQDYYYWATEAEALLLLERFDEVLISLKKAKKLSKRNIGNRSTTYKQLSLICNTKALSTDLIGAIRPPTVITYTGQMVHGIGKTPGIDPKDLAGIREEIKLKFYQHNVGIAYGALACGADILIAEEILQLGGELNVILPFAKEEFRKISVTPAGKSWEKRFDTLIKKANSISYVVDNAYSGYELLFETCALQSMGRAFLRAKQLDSIPLQVAIWNQSKSSNKAGTAQAIRTWKKLGQKSEVIKSPLPKNSSVSKPISSKVPSKGVKRKSMALIFADVKGFSKLTEQQLPKFTSIWFRKLDQIIKKNTPSVVYSNTWGDAVYLVIDNVSTASLIATQLTRLFTERNKARIGSTGNFGLRVAAHFGPVFEIKNRISGKNEYMGMHVNQTARLEPCTPVNEVYVTESFAAQVSLEGKSELNCEYVGKHPLPKDFGEIRMYHLTSE